MSRRIGKHAGRDTGSTTGVATGVLALLSAGTLAALGVVTAGQVREVGGPSPDSRPGRTAAAPSAVVVTPTPSPAPGGPTGGHRPTTTHQGGGPVQPGSFLLGPGTGVSLSASGGATPAAVPTPAPTPTPTVTPPAPPVVVPVALPSPSGHVQAPHPVHPAHPVHPSKPADVVTVFALAPAPAAKVTGHGVGNPRASEVSGKPVKASKPGKPGAPLTPVVAGEAVGQRPVPTADPAAKPGKGPKADKPAKPTKLVKGAAPVGPSVPSTPAPTPTPVVTPTVGVEHGKALGHAKH